MKWNITGEKTFIGISNYLTLFKDEFFWESLWHTIYFVLINTPIVIIIAFLLALMITNKSIKKSRIYRTIFFAPLVLSVPIVSYIWLYIYQPTSGLLATINNTLGIQNGILWISDPSFVWWAIVIITTWWTVGFSMTLYIAAIQDIPDTLYEAARIDGAKSWQNTIYITLPSLKSTHVTVFFLEIIASFKIFGQAYLVTRGGPSGASRTFIQYIYETAFNRFEIGLGSAAAFVLFVVILVVSILQIKLMNKK